MPKKGYKQTKEHIENLRKTKIGKISPLRGRIRLDMIGDKNPAKRLGIGEKISKALKGIPSWNKGGRQSKEWTEKIRQANLGQKRTEASKKKMSEVPHLKGEKHPNWQGGISKNPYPKEFSIGLKLKIRIRDNFTCCLCGRTEREELEELNRALSVNHKDFNKNNCKENNLNTLCLRCNVKINREREYWTNYFNQ